MVANRVSAPSLSRPSAQKGLSRASAQGRRQAGRSRVAEAFATWSLRIGDTVLLWLERARQRRALGSLSDHMLKDLGLSRSDTGREIGKGFWEG
jgi:uncharacterized protein YjiS (DUF1127 family)